MIPQRSDDPKGISTGGSMTLIIQKSTVKLPSSMVLFQNYCYYSIIVLRRNSHNHNHDIPIISIIIVSPSVYLSLQIEDMLTV